MEKKISNSLLEEREDFVCFKEGHNKKSMKCDGDSVSGSVSQRACVYCGARVVLNPITDAYHIVHGPIGCASYTWDIRGSLSSGDNLYRNSFSTDLSEQNVIFGGEKKLIAAIEGIMENHNPKLIFVYATCIVGVIGDDVKAVCKMAEEKYNVPVIPVMSPGFSGNKSKGYKLACNALMNLFSRNILPKRKGINMLGDFNLAGEIWIVKEYLKKIGVDVISTITGDSSYDKLIKASSASFNVVQCAGSMTYLAKRMEAEMDIPFVKISFVGLEDTKNSLLRIASLFGDEEMLAKAKAFVKEEEEKILPILEKYKENLRGKKAAIYVGGGFKAISLIKQFNELGIDTVMVGTQTGKKDDYEVINSLVKDGTVVLDDANPSELEKFMIEQDVDILVGGVKERPLAYKLGVAFCDHNHERKHPLGGFVGAVNFAKEINLSINSPVWKYVKESEENEGI
ncbi:nitrogenase iron-molybdenum cofactor biosynthesis protein NifE [Clostridium beijerinckii]|jgi:nitrogenase molybdenum-iron cofactor biosynthesis protein NifE|uniref:Nitrogenase iron-molybdenum cofactor biosynthesis protein NifE n=2 Tax=Clostridium beijerinckii TaxID=1520 RepID=Q6DQY5_CLOBE|nr:nitrogenase iron-molybdenum cofactor biosynthesis protein NifE [Clostridium beijerinckii]AAT72325.1 NifE [Clostridium beijerinckii NCIMB 8052]ABR34174.1 nitrogenase MoFe cofactor biosynthesis protein NifE [Clostridium beijerinckii NCIMB 8052]AIU04441.1 nitrogenase MoFe cofactor biosynthesis protein NifE [Clostridium beijerinckii ATCC 35702]MBF7811219.1 nitrogenase iron-molybdenum cofactor biosynthesis protein NifE [Clostridium beijerinckii]NRT24525.1 nitrogenase molybdenum-cofactor synthesi